MKKLISIILALILLAAVPAAAAVSVGSQVGQDVSDFFSITLGCETIDGSVFSEYEVSVVTYWALWSADCRAQMAILQQIHEEHPEYGVFGLLHVDETSTAQAAIDFMAQNGYTFTVFIPDRVWNAVLSESMYIPESFIISRNSMIVEVWYAAFSGTELLGSRLALWAGVVPGSGDADGDGVLNTTDAMLTLRMVLGLIEATPAQNLACDVDMNGRLDSIDAIIILRCAMSVI